MLKEDITVKNHVCGQVLGRLSMETSINYGTKVFIEVGDKRVAANDCFGIMALDIRKNSSITVVLSAESEFKEKMMMNRIKTILM